MLLTVEEWYSGYERILQDCRPTVRKDEDDDYDDYSEDGSAANGDDDPDTKSVLLLCNGDVDALACARILTYMLRADGIPHQLLPCFGYQSFEQQLRDMAGTVVTSTTGGTIGGSGGGMSSLDDVRAIVLLNFGANRNLQRLWKDNILPPQNKLTVYVMDCRRPVHLANVHAPSERVCVFVEGTELTTDMSAIPSDGDYLSDQDEQSESSDEDDEEDDDDDEEEDGDDNRQRDSDDDDDDDDDDGEVEADLDDVEGISKKSKKATRRDGDHDDDDNYHGEDEQEDGPNDDDDDDDDDEDENRIRNRNAPPSKRQKTTTSGSNDANQEDDGNENNNGGRPNAGTQGGNEVMVQLSQRERHQNRLDAIRGYYEYNFFGTPASYIAYEVVSKSRFEDDGDLLWLACVGVTDAYLHSRLDVPGYAAIGAQLKNQCHKLFPNNRYERTINHVYAEDLAGTDASASLLGGGNGGGGGNVRTKITFSENGRIYAEDDYKFFLLRHSSLIESMVQSDYVSTRLQVWTKKGQQRLMEMLAKMGYPLNECKQPFVFMKPSLRRRLTDKIKDHAEEYNLQDFFFTSFMRVTGYNSLISASDTSYAVTALLERDPQVSSATSTDAINTEEKERQDLMESFNEAYDALSPTFEPSSIGGGQGYDTTTLVNGGTLSTSVGLGAGIMQARALQSNIIQLAVGLVERKAITLLKYFRYAYVTSNTVGETQFTQNDLITSNMANNAGNDKRDHIFSKPLALTRLASYLMDMHRENGQWVGAKARPLVLIAEKPKTNTCLVIGYEPSEKRGHLAKRKFEKHFRSTANTLKGITFKFDHFDTNVVEMAGHDVQRFLEQLHYYLKHVEKLDNQES